MGTQHYLQGQIPFSPALRSKVLTSGTSLFGAFATSVLDTGLILIT